MIKYKSKNLIFIIPMLFLVFSYVYYKLNNDTKISYSSNENSVLINNVPIAITAADEVNEQWQGLSGKTSLGAYNGMLFVFSTYQIRTFVMRNMNFPLDIIWIKDNKIVKIDKRLEPEKENPLKRYTSPEPINYVLEVNGGLADSSGFKIGDEVIINYDK